jgi:hypothetical protein
MRSIFEFWYSYYRKCTPIQNPCQNLPKFKIFQNSENLARFKMEQNSKSKSKLNENPAAPLSKNLPHNHNIIIQDGYSITSSCHVVLIFNNSDNNYNISAFRHNEFP